MKMYLKKIVAGLLVGFLGAGITGFRIGKATAESLVGTAITEGLALGECRVTGYCACEKCCGPWAAYNTDGVVVGAAGVPLEAGVSCGSPWPIGTVVEIEGLGEFIVHDKPAQWVEDEFGPNQFDLYFDNHQQAYDFGLRYLNVVVIDNKRNADKGGDKND